MAGARSNMRTAPTLPTTRNATPRESGASVGMRKTTAINSTREKLSKACSAKARSSSP